MEIPLYWSDGLRVGPIKSTAITLRFGCLGIGFLGFLECRVLDGLGFLGLLLPVSLGRKYALNLAVFRTPPGSKTIILLNIESRDPKMLKS